MYILKEVQLKQTYILFLVDYVVDNNVVNVPVMHEKPNELCITTFNNAPINY